MILDFLPENQISLDYRYIDLNFTNIADIIKWQQKKCPDLEDVKVIRLLHRRLHHRPM